MIRVNLAGGARKKTSKAKAKGPTSLLPIALFAIVLATVGGGYYWYSSLTAEVERLTGAIGQAEQQKAALEAVIAQDAIFEARKKELENRIKIIEGLKRSQVSPVVSLDILDDAIDRTEYVWLANLDQNNTVFTMSGTGTSVDAIADFVSNLEATGYFKNINLVNAQDSEGNYTFSMSCEFAPRAAPADTTPAAGGAN